MRKRCLNTVYRLARKNKNVVFIGSDLGPGTLEKMRKELPGQFLMEGISEQNIAGMAAGLALSGKTVYINTIASFLVRRCFEQSVVDLGLEKLPVRLLGSGGGLVYGPLGPTHMAMEDLSVMRAVPNMCVMAPSDADEMERAVLASERYPGPIYLRIARGGEAPVSGSGRGFKIGRAVLHRRPGPLGLITTGVMLNRALEAARELGSRGIRTGVLHLHTLKPFDGRAAVSFLSRTKAALTLEENTLIGGLGSAVAEALADAALKNPPRLVRLGLPDSFDHPYGSQEPLLKRCGLDAPGIVRSSLKALAAARRRGR